jgi:AcrR family transcriptional regulator
VHHYFGGIREVFLAVIADRGGALSEVRTAGTETPFDERIAFNIAAALDVIAANRATWLAVAGHGDAITDPRLRELIEATVERNIQRTLDVNADIVDDTPAARLALRCHYAFSSAATRAWLTGEATRAETETLLITASRDLLRHTIPALLR